MTTTIVKRHHHIEPYDERKLMRSIYAACLAARAPEGEAEITAKRVERDLYRWTHEKPEITSHDIRVHAAEILHRYNPHAATIYKHYGIID